MVTIPKPALLTMAPTLPKLNPCGTILRTLASQSDRQRSGGRSRADVKPLPRSTPISPPSTPFLPSPIPSRAPQAPHPKSKFLAVKQRPARWLMIRVFTSTPVTRESCFYQKNVQADFLKLAQAILHPFSSMLNRTLVLLPDKFSNSIRCLDSLCWGRAGGACNGGWTRYAGSGE